jgi:hypothetical protein
MEAAGIETLHSLERFMRYVEAASVEDGRTWLRGERP